MDHSLPSRSSPGRITALICVAAVFASAASGEAPGDTLEGDLRSYVDRQFDAWNRADLAAIDLGWARGFGFRARDPRTAEDLPLEVARQQVERWFKTLERFEMTAEELHVSVLGDIGLVWGFHIEDFQIQGKPPERLRVRSSMTLRRTAEGRWEPLLTHRDIQPFGSDGFYIPAYSEGAPRKP